MTKRKISFIRWHIGALIFLATFFPKYVSAQGDATIIPGIGVGVIKLSEDIDDILKKISPADSKQWRTAQLENEEKMMWLSLEKTGMSLAFDFKTRKLKKILVLTKALLVQNTSLRVGSNEIEVIEFFGRAESNKSMEKNKSKEIAPMDYPQLGIKFYVDLKNHTVRTIEVYERQIQEIRDHRSYLRF